jgi:hypothetical protein
VNIKRGYAEYKNRKAADSAGQKTAPYTDDLARLILFFIIFCAFGIGYVIHSHENNPRHLLRESVERTIRSRYIASIEGKTSIGDSVIALYRIREEYRPGTGVAELFSAGDAHLPFTSLDLLNRARSTVRAKEMRREDMYGHPTRHFYGIFTKGPDGGSEKGGVYFEFWMDFKDLTAVRLTITTVNRNVTMNAAGDSLSKETYLNIRYTR